MIIHFLSKGNQDHFPKEFFGKAKRWIYKWDNSKNETEKGGEILGNFRKINLFVGANNSGKSRFLRGLIKLQETFFEISERNESVTYKHKSIRAKYQIIIRKLEGSLKGNLPNIYNSIKNDFTFSDYATNYSVFENIAPKIIIEYEETKTQLTKINNPTGKKRLEEKLDLLKEMQELNDEVLFVKSNTANKRKYIPILRSSHANEYLASGNFKNTINDNYQIKDNVYTGLELYEQVRDLKNASREKRQKVEEFEIFLSKNFFKDSRVEITANSQGKKELLFSVDDIEHSIYDIGDGIQSLIIILFPIFTANDNDWFFIEEPETNLHPGLQRIFIETLLNDKYLNSKGLKYFFTTHSNHFLDITISSDEISIFQFKRDQENKFFIKNNIRPDKEILDILGVNTSSVFLANTSIWVEGPTDRKYLSKLLKLYAECKNEQYLREDIDFAFFEYGGNLIEHYLFDEDIEANEEEIREKINSFALSNKIFLLADNDNVRKITAKGKRRLALERISSEQENFTYQNTLFKEIENLLPKKIIKDFMMGLVKRKEDVEKLNNFDFDRSEYTKIGLGDFYENKLKEAKIPKKYFKSFKARSGTLTNDYKIKLSNFVIDSRYAYSEFIENNEELEKIIETLYDFIKK